MTARDSLNLLYMPSSMTYLSSLGARLLALSLFFSIIFAQCPMDDVSGVEQTTPIGSIADPAFCQPTGPDSLILAMFSSLSANPVGPLAADGFD